MRRAFFAAQAQAQQQQQQHTATLWVVAAPGGGRVLGLYEREHDAVVRASEEQAAVGHWCSVTLMPVCPHADENDGVVQAPTAASGGRLPLAALPPAARQRAEARARARHPTHASPRCCTPAGGGNPLGSAVERFRQLCGPAASARLAHAREIAIELADLETGLVERRVSPEDHRARRDALRAEHAELRAALCALARALLASDIATGGVSAADVVDAVVLLGG